MDNLMELEKVQNQYTKLMEELGKRLYGEYDKEQLEKFNNELREAQSVENLEEKVAALNKVAEVYPELFELLAKQNKVENSLRTKDVEIELTEIDRKPFVKAIMMGNQKASYGLFDIFEPMFLAEKKETETEDFSELDELINE